VGKPVSHFAWHQKGEYFATVTKQSSANSVLIHRLSQAKSQSPFTKSKGLVQRIAFHPFKPIFFVASQRVLRAYDLSKQKLVKKMSCPARWISSLAVHPSGDHLLVGSYDQRVCWYDLDGGSRPYQTLQYHKKAIRQVAYHNRHPLFVTSSDDGALHVFHATVYTDLLTNPLIVPVKIIKVESVLVC